MQAHMCNAIGSNVRYLESIYRSAKLCLDKLNESSDVVLVPKDSLLSSYQLVTVHTLICKHNKHTFCSSLAKRIVSHSSRAHCKWFHSMTTTVLKLTHARVLNRLHLLHHVYSIFGNSFNVSYFTRVLWLKGATFPHVNSQCFWVMTSIPATQSRLKGSENEWMDGWNR